MSGWDMCGSGMYQLCPQRCFSDLGAASIQTTSAIRFKSPVHAVRVLCVLYYRFGMPSHGSTWSHCLMNAQRVSTASANPVTINTARVLPSDPRIEYNSSTYWVDTTQDSGAGSCTNGTRVAKVVGASFTFAFSGMYLCATTSNAMNHLSVQGYL